MAFYSNTALNRLASMAGGKGCTVFTDLDRTSCVEFDAGYAARNTALDGNKTPCYMEPSLRRAFEDLRNHTPDSVFFVTGRHFNDVRIDDVTGRKIPDGAFHDLLGARPEYKTYNVIAGHGRLRQESGRSIVFRRSDDPEQVKAEQAYEKYVGSRVLALKKDFFKKFPEARGEILGEFKKHLSYFNIKKFMGKSPRSAEAFEFLDQGMRNIFEGRKADGSKDKTAPSNPGNAFDYVVEPTGSMEIRSKSQNKKEGLQKSGFLEKALLNEGPVFVLGDSLGQNGTDRDMFEGVKAFFKEHGQENRLFLVHVLNGADRLTDPRDPCFPDISIEDPSKLGEFMKAAVPLFLPSRANGALSLMQRKNRIEKILRLKETTLSRAILQQSIIPRGR